MQIVISGASFGLQRTIYFNGVAQSVLGLPAPTHNQIAFTLPAGVGTVRDVR